MRRKVNMDQGKQTRCNHIAPAEQKNFSRQEFFQLRLAQGTPRHFLKQGRHKEEKRVDAGAVIEKKPTDSAQAT